MGRVGECRGLARGVEMGEGEWESGGRVQHVFEVEFVFCFPRNYKIRCASCSLDAARGFSFEPAGPCDS